MQTVPGSTPTHYWLETSEYTTNKILQYRMNHPPLNIQRTKSYNTEWTTHLWIYNEQNLTTQSEQPTSEYTTHKMLQRRVFLTFISTMIYQACENSESPNKICMLDCIKEYHQYGCIWLTYIPTRFSLWITNNFILFGIVWIFLAKVGGQPFSWKNA